MSPHTVTHIDLPWALDSLFVYAPNDPRVSRSHGEAQDYLHALMKPQIAPALFVNLTDYKERNPLLATWEETTEKKRAFSELAGKELADLLWSLAIDRKTLNERTPAEEKLRGKLLVLHTGWTDQFAPKDQDLSSPIWEVHHPWLTHPWLDGPAVDELMRVGIAGIAIDAPMADCPMYLAGRLAATRRNIRVARDLMFAESPDREPLRPEQPAHVRLLSAFKLFAESLDIPDDVCKWYPPGRRYVETSVLVCGLYFHLLPDAALMRFVARDPRKGGNKPNAQHATGC